MPCVERRPRDPARPDDRPCCLRDGAVVHALPLRSLPETHWMSPRVHVISILWSHAQEVPHVVPQAISEAARRHAIEVAVSAPITSSGACVSGRRRPRGMFRRGKTGARQEQPRATKADRARRHLWPKIPPRGPAGCPFAEELGAAALTTARSDPQYAPPCPARRCWAHSQYFVMPFDAVPRFPAGVQLADDAAILATAVRMVATHITPEHRAAARAALDGEKCQEGVRDHAHRIGSRYIPTQPSRDDAPRVATTRF